MGNSYFIKLLRARSNYQIKNSIENQREAAEAGFKLSNWEKGNQVGRRRRRGRGRGRDRGEVEVGEEEGEGEGF